MDENQHSSADGTTAETKFCKECGQKIAKKAVICPLCGCQIEEIGSNNQGTPNIIINNQNQNQNQQTVPTMREKNKWVALILCIFLGVFGAHKFYEGKIGMGILYLFSFGLFGIGVVIDFICLLFKRNPYYI